MCPLLHKESLQLQILPRLSHFFSLQCKLMHATIGSCLPSSVTLDTKRKKAVTINLAKCYSKNTFLYKNGYLFFGPNLNIKLSQDLDIECSRWIKIVGYFLL